MELIADLFQLILVVPMTNVLIALARLFGGNFGISIIVFTLIMKFITWPLTASQYKQSRRMQEMQPKMQELQKKYKGKDPKKLQAETMALYREAGVNPLGCLFPMLAQFPIWIALYQVINTTLGETPESLVTLSQKLYPLDYVHSALPITNQFLFWNLGQSDPTYILPLLTAVTMYVQQKLITPTPTAAPATPQAAQQQQTQQMMLWMMPLMFGFFALSVPAGLALYWAVSNLAGIVLQYLYMGRKLDFGSLFKFGPPPAPAPGVRGTSNGGRSGKRDKRSNDIDEDGAADMQSEPAPDGQTEPAAIASSDTRRKRHGRRRGKR